MLFGCIVLLSMGLIYFIPTIVADIKRHENRVAIFAINLLFGWSFAGWLIALAWAFNGNKKNKNAP